MQFEKHKKAVELLKEIDRNPENYLIIHYSCESFYGIEDGHTPRITSIAVYSYYSAQTDSFSIHKIAEKANVLPDEIEEQYDKLERSMLDDFYAYVKEHKTMKWLHWNMRDINYGFKAIEHRYEVLGGSPVLIEDANKIDLARLFVQCYGVNYIEHPRLQSICDYNHITQKDFLSGSDEAKAFTDKEYVKLHRSTLRKVDIFSNLLNRAINGTLKVKSKWWEIYGISPQGIYESVTSKWWFQLIWTMVSLVLGAIVGHYIETLF